MPLVLDDPVLLVQFGYTHRVVQDGVLAALVKGGHCIPEPHEVDVHVGRAHSELADVLIKRISLKPHRTQECDSRELVVENILSIDYPNTCNVNIVRSTFLTFFHQLVRAIYGHCEPFNLEILLVNRLMIGIRMDPQIISAIKISHLG